MASHDGQAVRRLQESGTKRLSYLIRYAVCADVLDGKFEGSLAGGLAARLDRSGSPRRGIHGSMVSIDLLIPELATTPGARPKYEPRLPRGIMPERPLRRMISSIAEDLTALDK